MQASAFAPRPVCREDSPQDVPHVEFDPAPVARAFARDRHFRSFYQMARPPYANATLAPRVHVHGTFATPGLIITTASPTSPAMLTAPVPCSIHVPIVSSHCHHLASWFSGNNKNAPMSRFPNTAHSSVLVTISAPARCSRFSGLLGPPCCSPGSFTASSPMRVTLCPSTPRVAGRLVLLRHRQSQHLASIHAPCAGAAPGVRHPPLSQDAASTHARAPAGFLRSDP